MATSHSDAIGYVLRVYDDMQPSRKISITITSNPARLQQLDKDIPRQTLIGKIDFQFGEGTIGFDLENGDEGVGGKFISTMMRLQVSNTL